jgi:hypothetical protein
MVKPVDRTIDSNVKCEHCRFHNCRPSPVKSACFFHKGVVLAVPYWRKCENFTWREEGDPYTGDRK